MAGLNAVKPKANAPKYAYTHTHTLSISLMKCPDKNHRAVQVHLAQTPPAPMSRHTQPASFGSLPHRPLAFLSDLAETSEFSSPSRYP